MCGIAGALVFEGSSFRVTENYLRTMLQTMVHRGPDGEGVWLGAQGKIGLGHRRLSIIDLSNLAAQPMSNEDGTVWVSFNGEIYNHAEIRRELEAKGGHRWKTDHSDTEVIVHAFEEWGIECIHKFRGMFAIALWDTKKEELWLIRDRIGIKPLYYSIHHGRITFASEIKALLTDPEQKRAVNEEAFYHYLSFLTAPAPQTLFAGIQKLSNGCLLHIKANGTITERRYWDVYDYTQPLTNVSEADIAEQVLETLRTSVKYRMESDVPVGVFLSGGIDSSTNAVLFSELAKGKSTVNTFTIGYRGEYETYKNETEHARRIADIVGAQHHEEFLTIDQFIDFLPQMVHLQDEPIADPVCFPVYRVSKMARDAGVIVCQVGEGSDELFWGYPSWKRALMLERLNHWPVPAHLKRWGLRALERMHKEETPYYEWLRRGSLGQPIFWGGTDAVPETVKQRLLSPRLRKQFAALSSWDALAPIHQRFKDKAWEQTPVNWMSYVDLNLRLPELMLMRVDKMSMGVSLEGRVPFLDHKFVELAMSIPEHIKTKNGTLKHILKKAVSGVIPDDFITRPKQGFHVPVLEWFFDKLGPKTKQELDRFCERTDFLDKKTVHRILEQGRGMHVWYLLNFALWWNHYIDTPSSQLTHKVVNQ